MSRRDSRFRQGLAVAAIELGRRMRGRQVLGLLFVAGIPLALVGARLAVTVLAPITSGRSPRRRPTRCSTA